MKPINRDRVRELLPVLTAFVNGEPIQMRNLHGKWVDLDEDVVSPEADIEYRVKPKPREFWLNIYYGKDPGGAYETRFLADSRAGSSRTECIKVVEVL